MAWMGSYDVMIERLLGELMFAQQMAAAAEI
jgi:hypothetical protein